VSALRELLRDATAGDPISGLRWTHKTAQKLAEELQRQGFRVGRMTVARLLRQSRYSLRTNRKRLAGTHEPDRDRQFRLLARRRRWFQRRHWPVLSVDTKKKEWVGNFKNAGRCWRRQALAVWDHDFPSLAVGRAIPYGIYDETRNAGYVVIGTSHETAAFAVAALRTWWLETGRWCYPRARRLAIEADCGGANGNRSWGWRIGLQALADEFGLTITVGHYPPGASKWNWIEHRMFNLISANWSGQPLISYETVLNFIRTTTSPTGFRCRACLDETCYDTKAKVTPEEKTAVKLRWHKVLPQWNYTIWPRSRR
jgi:Rhodopirellula transposase DDE domain